MGFVNYLQPTGAGHYVRLHSIARIINEQIPPGGLILDLGGDKGLLYSLLRRSHRAHYALFDRYPGTIARPIIGSLERLPLRSESAAVIILSDVLEHVDNEEMILGGSWDVLRPGGILIIHTPSLRQPRSPIFERAREAAEAHDPQPFPHVRDGYTTDQLWVLAHRATGQSSHVFPTFTREQSLVAELDFWLWFKHLTIIRSATWVAIRLLLSLQDGPTGEYTSSGLMAIVPKPPTAVES